jgi:hypothetical protein
MSTYNIPNINNKPPILADLAFYCDIRFDPDDSLPIYIGFNVLCGANTSTATDWKLLKFTYATGDTTASTRIQTAYGTWNNRATYF